MMALFLCVYVNKTHWPHFGLNILLNFAHGSEVRKACNLALKQKKIKFDHQRGLLWSFVSLSAKLCNARSYEFMQCNLTFTLPKMTCGAILAD